MTDSFIGEGMSEGETFVSVGMDLTEVEEPKPVDEGIYNLVIEDVTVKEDEATGAKTGALVKCVIEGYPDAASVFHNLSFPQATDPDDKKKTKALFLKRFLVLFNIPFTNGINLNDFAGKRATAKLKLDTWQDMVKNVIVLPMVK